MFRGRRGRRERRKCQQSVVPDFNIGRCLWLGTFQGPARPNRPRSSRVTSTLRSCLSTGPHPATRSSSSGERLKRHNEVTGIFLQTRPPNSTIASTRSLTLPRTTTWTGADTFPPRLPIKSTRYPAQPRKVFFIEETRPDEARTLCCAPCACGDSGLSSCRGSVLSTPERDSQAPPARASLLPSAPLPLPRGPRPAASSTFICCLASLSLRPALHLPTISPSHAPPRPSRAPHQAASGRPHRRPRRRASRVPPCRPLHLLTGALASPGGGSGPPSADAARRAWPASARPCARDQGVHQR